MARSPSDPSSFRRVLRRLLVATMIGGLGLTIAPPPASATQGATATARCP